MVYIVPTEAPSAPTYIYISYWMLIITNLTYICNVPSGLTNKDCVTRL